MFNPYANNNINNIQYNPISGPYNAFNNNTQQLVRVNGIEGAKAYQMNANSTVALFDNNEDVMYIKMSDGAGFPTIRTFKFEEITKEVDSAKNATTTYITRKDMEEYVEQFISKFKSTDSRENVADRHESVGNGEVVS